MTAIRAAVLPRIPSSLRAINGISVAKENGIWTIEPDWNDLALEAAIFLPTDKQVWIFDPASGVFSRITLQTLISAFVSIGSPRQVTTSTDTAQNVDVALAVKRTAPSSTTIQLGDVTDRGNLPLSIFDLSTSIPGGGHTIVVNPHAGQTIMNQASWSIFSPSDALLGGLRLYPYPAELTWVISP